MTVKRTLTDTFTEHHRIDSSPSSYRHYRHVHARRPLGLVVAEVAVVALAKIALLLLISWLLFAPLANVPVAVGTTPHVAPALPTSARVASQAPISTK